MSTDTDSMDDKTPIKYLLIGDFANNKPITEFSSGNALPKTKKEINQIFNKLCKTQNKKFDERNKITSKNENYYFTFLRPALIYIILSNNKYPERYIFELIHKINDERIPSMVNDETRELNPSGRQQLKQLIDFYQDPKRMSKIAEVQSDVDSLKIDMRDNINKMVDSIDNVNELQGKAEALQFETEQYNINAKEVKKLAWWQNLKLWIIFGMLVIIIILIFIIIFT